MIDSKKFTRKSNLTKIKYLEEEVKLIMADLLNLLEYIKFHLQEEDIEEEEN